MTRCLWLAQSLPFLAVDRTRSGRLAKRVAKAGAGITWHQAPGTPRGQARALAGCAPLWAALPGEDSIQGARHDALAV